MGQCSSYDKMEIVITTWASEIRTNFEEIGAVVPSNISTGVFIQFTADNNDLNEDGNDGKQTKHATTLVPNKGSSLAVIHLPKVHTDHSAKRRSLEQPVQSQIIQECSVTGKRPAVTSFLDKTQKEYFVSQMDAENVSIKENWLGFFSG